MSSRPKFWLVEEARDDLILAFRAVFKLFSRRSSNFFSCIACGSIDISLFRPDEAKEKAKMMIGANLITKQTDHRGKLCEEVFEYCFFVVWLFNVQLGNVNQIGFYPENP